MIQNIEECFDGSGLHFMLVSWCIYNFASYVLVIIVAFILLIFFCIMVGLDFVHRNNVPMKKNGVAGSAVFLVFLSLIPIFQKNYYV